jgi:protein phosphatase
MRVPVEGQTPSVRYGHSMVYIMPILFLYCGSGKNEILSDVWILSTEKTPFKWEKANISGTYPNHRVYHTSNLFKVPGNSEMMIVFGGRDKENISMNDVWGIRKDNSGGFEWVDFPRKYSGSDVVPVGRHQHCAAFLGPFLFIVGGRANGKEQATFDVYSMNKLKWHRFGNVSLFRHSIWIYYNITSQDKFDVFLYIYGGFDGDNNSQINPNMYKINVFDLFSQNESLKNELNDYISMLLLIQTQNKRPQQTKPGNTKNAFTLDYTVVAYQMGDDLGNSIRQLSLPKLQAEGQKIGDTKTTRKKYVYNEALVREFLQLMPLPEHFVPLTKDDRPILLQKDYILNLIGNCKAIVEKTPMLLKLKHPIKIFGSLFGQYNDLLRHFNYWGRPHEHRGDIESVGYLFLGNLVNRGGFSLEVLCLVLALKVIFINLG